MLGLRWGDISFENKQLSVAQNLVYANKQYFFKTPKTESGIRTIDLPSSLLPLLTKHKKQQLEFKLLFGSDYHDNNLIVCNPNGDPIMPGSFSHKYHRFLEKNGIRICRLHDLRHTNASLMLQYGVSPKVMSARLGHSNIGITMDLYTHVIGNLQEEASNKIEEQLFQKLDVAQE